MKMKRPQNEICSQNFEGLASCMLCLKRESCTTHGFNQSILEVASWMPTKLQIRAIVKKELLKRLDPILDLDRLTNGITDAIGERLEVE